MTAAAITPPRTPRPTENTTGSFVLAVTMHALLFAALWINVQWRTQPQGEVAAELWGALPPPVEVAPPPPPPIVERAPEPERRDADIVLQQERQKKLAEEKQRELEKKREAERRKLEEAKRKADDEKRAAAQREAIRKAEERRVLAQAAAGAPTEGAAGSSRGDASYAGQLVALIKPRIVFAVPEGTSPQIYADFEVDLLPTGEILAIRLLKASGLPGYDAAVERAIRRTDPFPRKRDGTVERTVTIRFRPVERQ